MKHCVHISSFLVFCLLFLSAASQNKLIDSLEKRLPQLKGKERRTALADLSWEYNSIDVNKSETYAQHLSEEVNSVLLSSDKPQTGALSQLTEREVEIVKLIAEGLSNKEIGEKLFISHRTVDTHRTNLMQKLGVHNIAGLVRLAIQEGLV